MFRALIEKEIQLALRSRRVWISLVAMSALALGAGVSGGREYLGRMAMSREIAESGAREFKTQQAAHPHSIAHNGYVVARAPAPLGYLDAGVDQAYGVYVRLDAHRTRSLQGARLADLARGPGAGRFDLGVLFAFFAPVFVVLLGYDQIAGERSRGTFAMLRALGMRAPAFVTSKVIGMGVRVGITLGLPMILGAVVAAGVGGGEFGLRGLVWLSLHAGALAVWSMLVLFLSARFDSREGALLGGLALWALLTLVVPPLAGSVARVARPLPPPGEEIVKAETWAQSAHEANEELRSRAVRDIQRRHPTWDGRGEPPEVLDAVMLRLADADIATKVAGLFARLQEEADEQERLATLVAFVSPAGLMSVISSAIAGSDLTHMRETSRRFESDRVALMAWFNDWWAKNGTGGFDAYDGEKGFNAFAEAPAIRMPTFSVGFALNRICLPSALLLLTGVVALMGILASTAGRASLR